MLKRQDLQLKIKAVSSSLWHKKHKMSTQCHLSAPDISPLPLLAQTGDPLQLLKCGILEGLNQVLALESPQ